MIKAGVRKIHRPRAVVALFFFFFVYSFLYQHHFSFIRGKWKNDSRNLDLVLCPPWKTGQGIASVPVTWRPQEWGGGRVFIIPLSALSFWSPVARVKCLHCTFLQTTDTLNIYISCLSCRHLCSACQIMFRLRVQHVSGLLCQEEQEWWW